MILLGNLLVLLLIEILIRATAGLKWVSLRSSTESGFDRLLLGDNAPVGKRLYLPDRDLIMRMRPHARIVYRRLAAFPGARNNYEVRTNARGFRTPDFLEKKAPGVFRIVCLGDSSTFGMNVEAKDAYPQILHRLLNEFHPGRFEVLNLGSPGFSSRQGLELIRREVLSLQPDLVIFAYGTNDRFWKRRTTDDDLIRLNQSFIGGVIRGTTDTLDHLYLFRLLERIAGRILQALELYDGLYGVFRVPIEGTAKSIDTSQELLARQGISFLVLNNDFFGTDVTSGIEMGVRRNRLDYLNMQSLFERVRAKRARDIGRALRLPQPNPPKGMSLMRVQASAEAREVMLEYQLGPGMARGETSMMVLHDDGREGDHVAKDGLWSVLVHAPPGSRINYFYWGRREGKRVKEFEDAYPPAISSRHAIVPASGVGDIDTFGDFGLFSDSTHPNEEGHRLISRALYDHLMARERVKAFLSYQ